MPSAKWLTTRPHCVNFPIPFVDTSTSMLGVQDCRSLVAHLRNKKTVEEKYVARHFSGIQLDYTYWLPGTQNAADCLADVKRDMAPLLRILQLGAFCPSALHPLRSAFFGPCYLLLAPFLRISHPNRDNPFYILRRASGGALASRSSPSTSQLSKTAHRRIPSGKICAEVSGVPFAFGGACPCRPTFSSSLWPLDLLCFRTRLVIRSRRSSVPNPKCLLGKGRATASGLFTGPQLGTCRP